MTLKIYSVGMFLSEEKIEDLPAKPYVILTGDLDSVQKAAQLFGLTVELIESNEVEE